MTDRAARSMKSTRAGPSRAGVAPGHNRTRAVAAVDAGRESLPAGHARPLLPALASEVGQRFGQDFSSVRVHQDAQAQASAETLHARAYTFGEHIVLGRNAPPPDTHDGKRMLAHELAHVVQQRRGGPPPALSADAPHEHSAERAAANFVSGTGAVSVSGATGVGVARDPDDDVRKKKQGVGKGKGKGQSKKLPGVDAKTDAAVEKGIVEEPTTQPPPKAPKTQKVKTTQEAKDARKKFSTKRDTHAQALSVGKGGQVHHGVELQALKRYPGAFTAEELNARENMRGIRPELEGKRQLHNAKIREAWDKHYNELDAQLKAKGLKKGTPAFRAYARKYLLAARAEMDYLYGQFYSETHAAEAAKKGKPEAKTKSKPKSEKPSSKPASKAEPKASPAPKAAPSAKSKPTSKSASKPAAKTAPKAAPKAPPKAATAPKQTTPKAVAPKAAAPKAAAPKAAPKAAAPKAAPKAAAPKAAPKAAAPKAAAPKAAAPKAASKAAAPKAVVVPKPGPKATSPKAAPKTPPQAPSKAAPKTAPKAPLKAPPKAAPKAAPQTPPKAAPDAAPKAAAPKPAAPKPAPKSGAPKAPPKAAPKATPKAPPKPGATGKGFGSGLKSLGGGALSVAAPIIAGEIHNRAVEKRIDKQSDEQGFVPHNAPSGEGLAYDLGAWLIDPMRDAEKNVDNEKRFKISPWRQKVRNVANSTPQGGTFDFTWEDPYCGQDLFGHPEVKYRYQKVTYKKGADGRLSVESGDASGTLDLNDVISEEISDEEIDSRIPRSTCGGGYEEA